MTKNIKRDFSSEFSFRFSRSSGPGGQNVNKVSTRVEVIFSIPDSVLLTAREKENLIHKFASRLNKENELSIASQESRSQLQNKLHAINVLNILLNASLKPVKKRIATQPSRSSKTKRLDRKKRHGLKKENRRKPLL